MHSLGIAIGGGAARGFFHVGVIQALAEAGIEASCVSGTSVGAIVAAFYASGVPLEELSAATRNVQWGTDVFDWRHTSMNMAIAMRDHLTGGRGRRTSPGLLEASRLGDFINRLIGGKTFSTVKPLVLTSTDIQTGDKIMFASPAVARELAAARPLAVVREDAPPWAANYEVREVIVPFEDLGMAARASCCFPGVISSVSVDCPELNGPSTRRLLNDGGICEQVPVKPLRALGCRKVLAVHLGYVPTFASVDHALAVQLHAVQYIARPMIAESLRLADHVIYDPKIETTSMVRLDFALVKMGYEFTRDQLPAIRRALALDDAAPAGASAGA